MRAVGWHLASSACCQLFSQHEHRLVGIWGGACCLQVVKAMQALQQREGWTELPLYGLGISSGGAMVLLLPHMLEMQVGGMQPWLSGVPWSFCWLTCRGGMQRWFSGVPWMLLLSHMQGGLAAVVLQGCPGCFCCLTCRWGLAAVVLRGAWMLLLADMLQMQVGACSRGCQGCLDASAGPTCCRCRWGDLQP